MTFQSVFQATCTASAELVYEAGVSARLLLWVSLLNVIAGILTVIVIRKRGKDRLNGSAKVTWSDVCSGHI